MTRQGPPITYKPGRFTYLMKEAFVHPLWEYLTDTFNIRCMIKAAAQGLPALSPLLTTVEERFGGYIASEKYHGDDVEVMVNNMVLQIMNHFGYEHIACGMMHHGNLIKVSGVYQKKQSG